METMQGMDCQMDGCQKCMQFTHRIQEFDQERVCFECSHGFTRGFHKISRRYNPQCHPWPVNRCYTQAMQDGNLQGGNHMQSFEMEGSQNSCVDQCQHGTVPNFMEMRCVCPIGSHPYFKPNCDPSQDDCFERCECNAGSQLQGAECVCDDPNMNVTQSGCMDVHRNEQDCYSNNMTMFSA